MLNILDKFSMDVTLPFFSSISILLQQDMDSKNIIFKALQEDLSMEDAALFCCVLGRIWK
jgi:hypothetical protein